MTNTSRATQIVREWDQAWNHYRHLESARSQYLGFFFTVLLASVGLAISFLKDVKPADQDTVIIGLLILTFVVFLITIGLFTSIKKMGYVLWRYEVIINSARQEIGFPSCEEFPFNLPDMPSYPKKIFNSRLYSIQRLAEIILGVTSIILLSLCIFATAYILYPINSFSTWQKYIGISLCFSALVYAIAVFFPLIYRSN